MSWEATAATVRVWSRGGSRLPPAKKKKTKFTWGRRLGGRDENEDKNKRKRILKCGVGIGKNRKEKKIKKGCNWDVRLGRRERGEGIR